VSILSSITVCRPITLARSLVTGCLSTHRCCSVVSRFWLFVAGADWSTLPAQVLVQACELQRNALDNCAAACACQSWRSAVSGSRIQSLQLHACTSTKTEQWGAFLAHHWSCSSAQCFGALNLNLLLSVFAIACTVRCDSHLVSELPLSSHHGSTKIVSTGSVASSALKIAHLPFPWLQPRIQGSLVMHLSTSRCMHQSWLQTVHLLRPCYSSMSCLD